MEKPFKVFGIGFNRTGTSSLKLALRRLGYKTLGKNQPFVSLFKRGKFEKIFKNLDEWDGYQDWPWPMLYAELLDHFGDKARFVLTRRSSPEKWVESLKRHSERTHPDKNQRRLMLGYGYPHGLEAEHIGLYETHYYKVRNHFEAQGQAHLLGEFCWEEGDAWPELCAFLNEPLPDKEFPRANTSEKAAAKFDLVAENHRRIAQQMKLLGLGVPEFIRS